MSTQEIVQKLWGLCNILRDDGITYHQYVTELTWLLFLKMAKETGRESQLPKRYRWDDLETRDGVDLLKHYRLLLVHLGSEASSRVQAIFSGASSSKQEKRSPHGGRWQQRRNALNVAVELSAIRIGVGLALAVDPQTPRPESRMSCLWTRGGRLFDRRADRQPQTLADVPCRTRGRVERQQARRACLQGRLVTSHSNPQGTAVSGPSAGLPPGCARGAILGAR